MELLKVRNLEASRDGKKILKGVNFSVSSGETVVLLGPNGAGKSSLVRVQSGEPGWTTKGEIHLFKKPIPATADARARAGLFVCPQQPPEIPGVSTTEMFRAALSARGEDLSLDEVRERISEAAKKLGLDIWFSEREMNVGFSGGEKKKNEILQMLVLRPKLVLLDEIDSGLDIDSTKKISKILADFQKETGVAYLIVTHNMRILEYLKVDRTLLMDKGCVVAEGDAKLASKVAKNGFKAILEGVK